ncbi:MAG: hydantoin utilization protein A [Planctomycetes bacterium]|nr:hydantoin utilization protein A [Planctomycetota bacterium]
MATANTLLVLSAGLGAGALHALAGPDHLAGVAPFAARAGRGAWRVGVAWGLGHAAGALLGAVIVLALRAALPGVEDALPAFSERAVGVVLCVVGAFGLHAALRTRVHVHPHAHDGLEHAHLHFSGRLLGREHARHPHAAFAIGLLHGAAGLSHLFAVLPALALPGALLPATYLAGYALACLAAVTGVAAAIGWSAPSSSPRRARAAVVVASAASLAVGALWIVHPI